MKTYLIGIWYTGEDFPSHHLIESNESGILPILRDFYLEDSGYENLQDYEDREEEELSLKFIDEVYFQGEDIVTLIFDCDKKKIIFEQ